MLLIDKNTFVSQKNLLIKFFQKESSQTSRHKHTLKMIFSTKLPFLCRNRQNSREKKGYSKCSNITLLLNQGPLQMASVTLQDQFFIATDTAQA